MRDQNLYDLRLAGILTDIRFLVSPGFDQNVSTLIGWITVKSCLHGITRRNNEPWTFLSVTGSLQPITSHQQTLSVKGRAKKPPEHHYFIMTVIMTFCQKLVYICVTHRDICDYLPQSRGLWVRKARKAFWLPHNKM